MFRFDGETFEGGLVELKGDEAHHAINVKRIKPSEAVLLTDGKSRLSSGIVESIDGKVLKVRIGNVESVFASDLDFFLVQALAKGDRDELAIQAATELGVRGVIPWQADRSISRWDSAKISKQVTRWQSICDEASKQSLRVGFPFVEQPLNSLQLAGQIKNRTGLWLVLDPSAEKSITEVVLPNTGEILLVVGPEGGITSDELSNFEAGGAIRVRLGQGILRTSTAGVAALAYLSAKAGSWG